MLYLKDAGLIIAKKPQREKNALVSLVTKRYGCLQALATGLRRPDSRLLGATEPGTFGTVYLAVHHGKTLGHGVIRLLSMLPYRLPGRGFRQHPYLGLWALRLLRTRPLLECSKEFWSLLEKLDRHLVAESRGFQVWFALQFFHELGEAPNFDSCNKCGYQLSATSYHSKGELYCPKCSKPSYEPVTSKDLQLIKKIAASNTPLYPYPTVLKRLVAARLKQK